KPSPYQASPKLLDFEENRLAAHRRARLRPAFDVVHDHVGSWSLRTPAACTRHSPRAATASDPGPYPALFDRLGLDRVGPGRGEGAAVEQLLGLLDLGRRTTRSRRLADIVVELGLGVLGL